MVTLTSLRIATAALIGLVAWHGTLWTIPLSLIAPCLVALQPRRLAAAGTSFAYYAAASIPMIAVVRAYWPSLRWEAIFPWLAASAILSLPGFLGWTSRASRRPWAIAGAIALAAVPPLCIVGWASPLMSAGVLFPDAGWAGIFAALVLPSLLVSERARVPALITAIFAAVVCNIESKPVAAPRGWVAVTTSIHRQQPADDLAEYAIEDGLQNIAAHAQHPFLVFPEGAVRRWTVATDEFWAGAIAGSGKTLLVGAGLPVPGTRVYNNSMVIRTEHGRAAVHQRIPVPGGMWNPFRQDGFAMNLLDSGTADIGGKRVAVLICYEQLLVWPMLRSAVERPTVLVAASNEAWTTNTRIPAIQHACVRAWARLFGLPLISAINS
jgi:apolipoprotein N-acyltransferase